MKSKAKASLNLCQWRSLLKVPNNRYKLRNEANDYATRAYYHALGYPVPSKYAKYKDPNLLLDYSHYKTKEPNQKFIKNLKQLFSNSDNFSTRINFYYSVLAPKSANIIITNKGKLTAQDFHGQNPYTELNHGYSSLADHFNKQNRKDKKNYTKIIRQHTETGKRGMNPHPHDNLLILSTKSLNNAKLSDLVSSKYYGSSHTPNQTKTSHVTTIKPYMKNKAKSKAQQALDKIVHYIMESTTQEPYCKHSSKAKKFKQDIKDTPDLSSYVTGVGQAVKDNKHPLSHTTRFSSIMNNLNKVSEARDADNQQPTNQKDSSDEVALDDDLSFAEPQPEPAVEPKQEPLSNLDHTTQTADKVFNSFLVEAQSKSSKEDTQPNTEMSTDGNFRANEDVSETSQATTDYRTETNENVKDAGSVRAKLELNALLSARLILISFDVHESNLISSRQKQTALTELQLGRHKPT